MPRPPDIDLSAADGPGDPTPEDLAPAFEDVANTPPNTHTEPIAEDPIRAILGDGGALAQLQPGYEERPAQLRMAMLVAEAFAEKRHAVIEAGTGTGKTLAYLVPALLSGRKVVVSTATKALQEQLVEKDLPLLQQLGAKFKFAVMKGRANYLCQYRKEVFDASPVFVSREEARLYPKLSAWADRTSTGDRAELEIPENYAAWRDVSSTADTCLGQDCPRWETCHVVRMKAKAAEADIVVVNHHLYFADVSVKRSASGRAGVEVIPRHEAVVFDEAHNLEETATDFFGSALSSYRVFDLCRDIDRVATAREGWPTDVVFAATSALGKTSEAWFTSVASLAPAEVKDKAAREQRFAPKPKEKQPDPGAAAPASLFEVRAPDTTREVSASIDEILARARVVPAEPETEDAKGKETRWTLEKGAMRATGEALTGFRGSILGLRGVLSALEKKADDDAPPDAELQGFLRRLEEIAVALDVLSADEVPGCVHWVELRGRGGVFVRASPVDVAGELAKTVFGENGVPVVMTSATLAAGGELKFFRHRIGLFDVLPAAPQPVPVHDDDDDGSPAPPRPPALEAILPSPFDYARQAALYLPRHLPEVNDPAWVDDAVREIAGLIALAEGRTFVLFTSHRQMKEVHARLAPRLPYRVLLQGQKPKGALLRDFREEPSVLFATQSFWEGVDVQGDALSMVVIDKLPFASPGDPLVAARMKAIEDRGGSSFGEYSLPSAAISLKQGFGRLIRSRRDTGCVAILDKRLWTKSYGRFFRKSLPPCPTFDRFADVKTWWKELRGSTGHLAG